jgi:hypothetical protein
MSNVFTHVTPLTRGIIWLVKDEADVRNSNYAEIDYLLDGLLTANLKSSTDLSSRLIIGQNFNSPLYVMIIKSINKNEVESFVSLIKKSLGPENNIIVLDECNIIHELKNELKDIHSHLRSI